MFQWLQMNTPMETIVDSLQPDFSHPIVIALGQRGYINQLFVVVERHVIALHHGLSNAVYRMLQLYYILNIEYADAAKHILHFLQRAVLQVDDDLPLSRSGSDLTLFIKRKAKPLQTAVQN